MIRIPSSDVSEMTECAEAILRAGGKLMSCIDKAQHSEMDERSYRMNNRADYRDNYLYPVSEDEMNMRDYRHIGMRGDDYYPMNERRMRDSRGRYM